MEKNMNINFEYLKNRILDTNKVSDLKTIKQQLSEIRESVICVGTGGSSVVSEFASKIFNIKNDCIAINREPRDLLYENITNYQNVFVCSYSGNNYGVDIALNNNLKKYLLTNGSIVKEDINIINYNSSIEKERSFISLGATLMPMSILLNYYLNGHDFNSIVEEMFNNINNSNIKNNLSFEIISGFDTSVAAAYLESTMVEAGLANPIIHSKYNYCHGRTTLAHTLNNYLIYLKCNNKELDDILIQESNALYDRKIILDSNYQDIILDEFNLTLKAMYLTKSIAEIQNKDLSAVKYAPAVKKLYYFRGDM